MVHYPLLFDYWLSLWYTTFFYWTNGYLYGTLPFSIGALAISMLNNYLLLALWISLGYTTLSFCHTGHLYGTLLSSTDPLYISLPSPIGPLAICMVHYYLLLAHWISLGYTTLSYWFKHIYLNYQRTYMVTNIYI